MSIKSLDKRIVSKFGSSVSSFARTFIKIKRKANFKKFVVKNEFSRKL
ncbi:hypothetical protein AM2_0564 [Lactococcus cremoris]|uniref:Uncharacterized protein n=1 Tax=Lactococcus lactis subsp. cremoris TaxID=1359 RepID=A0A161TYZ0_LACLC|nr:hypothetical protein AB996_1831 [Lactococcus cremoris]KZK54726.1 hypothetical protein AM2_0564 [Lactococcus cremoris]